jgi:hypothetical protein
VVRPNKRKRRIFEKVKRLFYLKYHIVAILDYLIILKVSVTSYKVTDCTTLSRKDAEVSFFHLFLALFSKRTGGSMPSTSSRRSIL